MERIAYISVLGGIIAYIVTDSLIVGLLTAVGFAFLILATLTAAIMMWARSKTVDAQEDAYRDACE